MHRLVAFVLALCLAGSACAGDRPTVEDAAAREVDEVAAGEVDPVPDRPLTLRLAVPADVSLDPADAGPASLAARVVADLRYEGLARIAVDGRPEPALAERWFVSEDRLRWTFVLPADLTDAAGESITARDVKHSLERVAARGPADQAATALTVVAGWADHMNGLTGGVAGIAAPDRTTLVIQLDGPFELLPDVLASPAYGITDATDDGFRVTGAYVPDPDDPDVLVARDRSAAVDRIELVAAESDGAELVADGLADWAVVGPDEPTTNLAADVIRQPLDLGVAVAVRLPDLGQRRALVALIEPLLLAPELEGLVARTVARPSTTSPPPETVTVDVPAGTLEPVAEALVGQLEAAGIAVDAVRSEVDRFAARVAGGEAQIFPVVLAGGTGPEGGVLRLAVPGGVDDVFGPESAERAELAAAVVSEVDVGQRTLFAQALERALVDEGLLLPIGRVEVGVAVSRDIDGLRHRVDGTLHLADVAPAAAS